MQYLVLARKYRPQGFADMTGQEHVVQTLTNALNSGRVAHALLLCGPRGCGKTTTARILAKALNCEKGPTPSPCGVCTPCKEITAGSDVDVQEIDAASNTGVDNVRELRESAKYLPARDRFKIFIVDEVHMLSKQAFNAFLKTLEEPPGHVKFLFATTDPQALPDTILSRCQRHNFRLVPLKQIVERLRSIARAENIAIDEGTLSLVARQAAGSMRDALSLLDQVFSACGGKSITEADAAQALGALDRRVVSNLAASLVQRDARGVLEAIGRAYDGGHDLKRLTEDLATHLRNLIASSVAGAPLDLPDHELKELREQSTSADPVELARLFDIVHGALYEISRATQPRHSLEIALLRAIYLAPSTSVQALLQRAEDLTRRLGGEPPPAGGGGTRPPASESRVRPNFGGPGAGSSAVKAVLEEVPPPEPMPMSVAPAAIIQAPAKPAPRTPPGNRWERHLSVVGSPPSVEESAPVAAPMAPAPPLQMAPAAVATSPEHLESPLAAQWAGLVERIRARKVGLGMYLTHARALSLDTTSLTLGFVSGVDDFAFKALSDERQSLQALLTEFLGSPTTVVLQQLEDTGRPVIASMAESSDKQARVAREGRLREGRENEVIRRAALFLSGEIEDVRDLGGTA